jgi:hypothetical protein
METKFYSYLKNLYLIDLKTLVKKEELLYIFGGGIEELQI